MKIGIISMQRVPNYGSFLQAFGLKKTLEELGNDVTFLDYKPEPPVGNYSKIYYALWSVKNTAFVSWLVDIFKYYVLQSRSFSLIYKREYLKKLGVGYRHNYREQVDLAIIGSDEVFNCTQEGFNVGYSSMLLGENINASKVCTYAASFGFTTLERIDKFGMRNDLTRKLSNIDAFSVRDNNSLEVLKELLPEKEVSLNLDPVLISDYDLDGITVKYSNYVLLYTYKSRKYTEQEIEEIKSFCKRHRKKLISLGDSKEWADIRLNVTPLEVLAYVKNADFVITDTFHGTVFSIKMNTPFVTRVREDNRQKLTALLGWVKLEHRIINDYKTLDEYYGAEVIFEESNQILSGEKTRTREYLIDNMKLRSV